MLEAGIQQLLAANGGVQAVIGTRIYPVLVPEDVTYPCASFQVISDVPEYLLDGTQGIGTTRIQVDTWSGGASNATYAAAKAAQVAIRAVLETFRGALPDGTQIAGIFVANALDTFEQDARAYRTTTDYMVMYYPAA